MKFNRFIPTNIFVLGANIYLADIILDILTMVSDGQEESLTTALLVINNSGHYYVDQYIDSPLTDISSDEDDDCRYLKMINTLENTLIKTITDNYGLFELLVEYIQGNKWVDIKGLTEGINVYYGERVDFDPHVSGYKTLYPNFD